MSIHVLFAVPNVTAWLIKAVYQSIHIRTCGNGFTICPVQTYKIGACKCRHQTAPQYLQELCVPVTASTSCRHLRSAARGDLQVLACRTTSFGPRSLADCAPKLWNSLPPSIRDPLTLTLFCTRLKTHLFGLA